MKRKVIKKHATKFQAKKCAKKKVYKPIPPNNIRVCKKKS